MLKAKGPIVSMPVVWATKVVPQIMAAINISIWAFVLLKIEALSFCGDRLRCQI